MAGQPAPMAGVPDPLARSITTITFPSSSATVAAEQQATAASASNNNASGRDRSAFLLARLVYIYIYLISIGHTLMLSCPVVLTGERY